MDHSEFSASKLSFPQNFIFGTSVAGFQVEGNTSGERKTDWDQFFSENADQIVRPGEIGANWWEDREKMEEDLKKISEMGTTMIRLSIEWGRVETERGHIDHSAINHYRSMIDLCQKYGLTPMITINHFTLPLWVAKKGGWQNGEIIEWIEKYALLLSEKFGDIKYWVIINEPANVVYTGNLLGLFPPNKRSLLAAFRTRQNIVKAQKRIYQLLKKEVPDSHVGNALSFLWFRSQDENSYIEKFLAKMLNYFISTNFASATRDYMDFLGVNYYTGYYVDLDFRYLSTSMRNEAAFVPHHMLFSRTVRPKTYKTDMGWPVVPDFFLDVLKHLHWKFKKPILITENGIADRDDIYRPFYILTHLVSVWKAMDEGVDIKGYIYWSTVDNLEWIEGFAKRFGLIAIDPRTKERKTTKGSKVFSEIIKNREILIERMIEEHIPKEQKSYARYTIRELLKSKKDHCPRVVRQVEGLLL